MNYSDLCLLNDDFKSLFSWEKTAKKQIEAQDIKTKLDSDDWDHEKLGEYEIELKGHLQSGRNLRILNISQKPCKKLRKIV